MNQLSLIVEFKNKSTESFFKSVQNERLVYAKWRGGKLVKAIYEGVY